MAKPIKTLELHYQMIQFLIKRDIFYGCEKSRKFFSLVIYSQLQRFKGMQTTKLRPLSKSQN